MTPMPENTGYTSFLGRGWSFPPEFLPTVGEVAMTADAEDVRASLIILLGTVLGERPFAPKYGLSLRDQLFEPVGTTTATYLKDRIKTGLLVHEARIQVLSIDLDTSGLNEGRLAVIVDYQLRATNSRYNLVYPFYTSDASEVRPSAPTPPA
jgi:phage baseplate assembly protein W